METIINWLQQNKEWVFSGIGIVVLSILVKIIYSFFVRKESKINKIQNQKSGDNSTNNQAGRDIVRNTNSMILYSVEEISRKLLQSAFSELPATTKNQIEK